MVFRRVGMALIKSATISTTIAVKVSWVMAQKPIPSRAMVMQNISSKSARNSLRSVLKAAMTTINGLSPRARVMIAIGPTPADSSMKKVMSGIMAQISQLTALGLARPARVALK